MVVSLIRLASRRARNTYWRNSSVSKPQVGAERQGLEGPVRRKCTLGHERMDMGVRIHHIPVALNDHHCAGNEGLIGQGVTEEGLDGKPRSLPQQAKKARLATEQPPQDFRDRHYILPVNYRPEHLCVQPLSKQQRALLVATRTKAVCFAGEGQEVFVTARVAVHSGKAVMQIATRKEAG